MIYLRNRLFLALINLLNKFKRGLYFKKKILSTQLILEKNFKINSTFNFIQVGANDGVSFDFLYDFVIKRNSSGLVIEPVPEYFKELKANYFEFPNIIPVNKAIHPTAKEIIIYKIDENAKEIYPDWVKGIASLDANHHKKNNIKTDDIVESTVKADTLINIIKQNFKNNSTDYFQIDTEGFDYEILKMINFQINKPSIVKYESVNLSDLEKNNSISLLIENGYYIFNEKGDTIGVDLRKIKIF